MVVSTALMCLALNIYHEARGEPVAGQDSLQPSGVRVLRRGDAVLPVDLRAGGHGDLLYLLFAERDRPGGIDGRAGRHEGIDVVAAGGEKEEKSKGQQPDCRHF